MPDQAGAPDGDASALETLVRTVESLSATRTIEQVAEVVRSAPRRFSMAWREHGGPPVQVPRSAGFGRRLLERGLARDLEGAVRLDFAPQGLRYTLEAPLSARISPP